MLGTIKRGDVISDATTFLVAETCPTCHCWFAIPKSLYTRMRENSTQYAYCPNGHSWHYTHSLREELKESRRETIRAESRAEHWHGQYTGAERSKAALKGVITRTRNRIGKGICPCCNRYFKNVAAHMNTQHPNYPKKIP